MYEPIYYTATSLLVFTKERKLKRIKCPFQVIARETINSFEKGSVYFVHRVYPSPENRLLYEINGQKFTYNTFEILI